MNIKVDIEFNTAEANMLEMAANLGHTPLTNDQIKTVLLSAAFATIKRYTMGVMEHHHTATNPPTPIDEERYLTRRLEKLDNHMARTKADLARLRSMRLKPVKS